MGGQTEEERERVTEREGWRGVGWGTDRKKGGGGEREGVRVRGE